MIIVRTCGSGTNYENERLKLLKKMVEYWIEKEEIFKLHDHKGTLTVYWFKKPSEQNKCILKNAWEFLGETPEYVEHVIVTLNEKML